MLKIKEITVGYSQTIQPRQYESIRANYEITVEIQEWEDVDKITQEAQNYVQKKVINALPNGAVDLF